jgi:hypothetical protein
MGTVQPSSLLASLPPSPLFVMSSTPIPHSPSGDMDLDALLETCMQEVVDMVMDFEPTIPSMDIPQLPELQGQAGPSQFP